MENRVKVLITVKTYPLPSVKYGELVCTAGMLEDGAFIRLYPIDYRYLSYWQSYRKYQWIDVQVEKHDPARDSRKESYRPNCESIQILGPPVGTQNAWQARKEIVLKRPPTSMETLKELQRKDNTSLGLVRPKRVKDLIILPDEEDWKPRWRVEMLQLRLFGPEPKPLKKVPYKFKYQFSCCDDRCRGHQMMIEDWEIGRLYFRELQRLGDKQRAAESVRHKFLNDLCGPQKDTYFFVGTVLNYGTWIICGVFYPPKIEGEARSLSGGKAKDEPKLF